MTTPAGKTAATANTVVNVDTTNVDRVGVFTSAQSLVTFPGAVAAVTTIWKVLGAVNPALVTSKVVPVILALLIGTLIYLTSATKGTSWRERLSALGIALVNSFTIAAAALGIA